MVNFNPFSSTFYKRRKKVNKKGIGYKTKKGVSEMSKPLKNLKEMTEKVQIIGDELLEGYKNQKSVFRDESKDILDELNKILNKNHENRKTMILKQDELSAEEDKLKEKQNEIADALIVAEIESNEKLSSQLEGDLNKLNVKIEAIKAKRGAYNRLSKSPMRVKEKKKIIKLHKKYKKEIINTTLHEEYQEAAKEFGVLVKELQDLAERFTDTIGSRTSQSKEKERSARMFTSAIGITKRDIIKALERHGVRTHSYDNSRPEEVLSLYVGMWLDSEEEEGFNEFVDNYIRTAIRQGKSREVELSQLELI